MDITKIKASLKHGKLYDKKAMAVAYVAMLIGFICILFSLSTITIVGMIEELKWDMEMTVICITLSIFGLLLIGVCLYEIVKNKKHKKEIIRCSDDIVNAKAFVKRLDVASLEYKPYQVQVDFEINGEKYHRISAPGSFLGGYHKIFARYDNKVIDILYSPKYDQVMILKEKLDP